jgi:hypothetical protein
MPRRVLLWLQRLALGLAAAGGTSITSSRRASGKRFGPYDLAEPGRLGRFNIGHVPLLGLAPPGRASRAEAPVGTRP